MQDTDDFISPKSSAGEITIITPENKTYTQPDSRSYAATYGFENDYIDIYSFFCIGSASII